MNGSRASVRTFLNTVLESVGPHAAPEVALCFPFPFLEQAERTLARSSSEPAPRG